MSTIYINYAKLEDAVTQSVKARSKIDNYISKIESAIQTPIGQLNGEDTNGYVQTASNLASQKMNILHNKKTYFTNFERTANSVISIAREKDRMVAAQIESIAEEYIPKRKWYQKVGDWLYNTFCVDLANKNSLTRDFMDCAKWVGDKIGNVTEKIHNWFKYGDGQYIWKIATSIVGAVASVAGAIGAICAIPFSGGATIPIVIGCIGAAATSIGAVITVWNSVATTYSSGKALSLSGNWLDDDDGNPGAARYYGKISKVSDFFEKTDLGDKETNDAYKKTGDVIDSTKKVADTTAFICNILNLGTVKDFDANTSHQIDTSYNGDKWYKGYSFTPKNIKKNILNGMGYDFKESKFKKGTILPKFKDEYKPEKYTLTLSDKNEISKKLVDIFNMTKKEKGIYEKVLFTEKSIKTINAMKTVDNTLNFIENVDGLYDFSTDHDKSFEDVGKAVEKMTGVFKNSDRLSIFDKYGTKTGKRIGDVVDVWYLATGN